MKEEGVEPILENNATFALEVVENNATFALEVVEEQPQPEQKAEDSVKFAEDSVK